MCNSLPLIPLMHREGYEDVTERETGKEKKEEESQATIHHLGGEYMRECHSWEGIIPRTFDLLFAVAAKMSEHQGWK